MYGVARPKGKGSNPLGCVWKCCVPLNPMVLLIIIPMKNGYFIGNINPTFSDKSTCGFAFWCFCLKSGDQKKHVQTAANNTHSSCLQAVDGGWSKIVCKRPILRESQNYFRESLSNLSFIFRGVSCQNLSLNLSPTRKKTLAKSGKTVLLGLMLQPWRPV